MNGETYMDGTLFDWSTRFAEILLDMDPLFLIVPGGQREHSHYFFVDGADRHTIMAVLNDPRLYQGLAPLPGGRRRLVCFLWHNSAFAPKIKDLATVYPEAVRRLQQAALGSPAV
ncbi:hypothetical protein [Arthrobacter sp. Br18]|uniref:hypothetical protein n=1 Tax=Arthrobacter sp. Br18 TaxID=1312954 RepID=UPI0004BB71D8|nr:hypothetical protein [Arthrobacter sp. Br18]